MSLVWSDETKQRELSQRQPMTRGKAELVDGGRWRS